ncbi:MAG: hypothetical protein IT340_17015 [Chloroflexi bacterium]|nr:hypothetical protein [Chloroflexota bacterium]
MSAHTPQPAATLGVIAAEAGGALLGGIVGGVTGFLIVSLLFASAGLGMGLLTLQVYGVIIGFGVGAGAGVALVGRWLGQASRLEPAIAMLGGVIGGVALIVAARVVPLRLDLFFLPIYAAVLAIGGAVLGFNLRRR